MSPTKTIEYHAGHISYYWLLPDQWPQKVMQFHLQGTAHVIPDVEVKHLHIFSNVNEKSMTITIA